MNNRILSTGYNGAPSKIEHCSRETCLRKIDLDNKNSELCRGVHAEVNTLIQCAIHGTKIGKTSKMYCTHFPCMNCTKLIINAGIKEIIFKFDYEMDNIEKFKLLVESKTKVTKCDETYFYNFNVEHNLKILTMLKNKEEEICQK